MDRTLIYLNKTLLGWQKWAIVYNAALLAEGLVGSAYPTHLAVQTGHRCTAVFGPHFRVVTILSKVSSQQAGDYRISEGQYR